jgi:hypothetical protein
MKRKRLEEAEKQVLRQVAPTAHSISISSIPLEQRQDMVRARRAMVAQLMCRNFLFCDIQLQIVKPVEYGGLGVFVEDSTLQADMKWIRNEWEADAKRRMRSGVSEAVAKLDYLERVADGADINVIAKLEMLLRVHDRRVHLLGLDIKTQSQLMLNGAGPATSADVQEILKRAQEIRTRDANTIDIEAEADA